jgi:transposase
MGADRKTFTPTQAESQGRSNSCQQSRLLGRHSVGAAERCAVEGFAPGVSVQQHLLAAIAGLGGARGLAFVVARLLIRTRRCGTARLARGVCRWHVCLGKKRGSCVGATKRGKGTKLMVVADGQGVPLGIELASASPHEVTLIEPLLRRIRVPRAGRGRPKQNPPRLIYDRAADSDPLRARLKQRGIELICPNRWNKKYQSQDGRPLRRYKRRWKIERTIAWLQNFRRLLVRYERKITMFQAFTHVACLIITLRQF